MDDPGNIGMAVLDHHNGMIFFCFQDHFDIKGRERNRYRHDERADDPDFERGDHTGTGVYRTCGDRLCGSQGQSSFGKYAWEGQDQCEP